MPIISEKLGILIRTKMIQNISAISGKDPSSQPNPVYFNNFCIGIAKGISTSSMSIIFKTRDSGLINPLGGAGTGVGIGVVFDSEYMIKTAYEKIRLEIIANFNQTSHAPYPPPKDNSGQYLLAVLKAISESLKEVYLTDLILRSTHSPICVGEGLIEKGGFSGLISVNVKNSIILNTPLLKGKFWPKFIEVLVNSYIDTVHNHSTAKVKINGAGSVPGSGVGFGNVT